MYFNNTNYFVIDVIHSNCKFCHFCHKVTSLSHFPVIDREPLIQASCWNAIHALPTFSGGLGYHVFIECEFLSVRVHIVGRTEALTAAPWRHLFFIVSWRSCRRFGETCWSLLSLSRKCLEVCKEQNYNLSSAANSAVSTQGSISPLLEIVLRFMYFQDDQLSFLVKH